MVKSGIAEEVDVSGAFDSLMETVEARIELTSQVGAKAFESHDFDKARQAITHAEKLNGFRERVSSLKEEWHELLAVENGEAPKAASRTRKADAWTSENEFQRPLLEALKSLGGSSQGMELLDLVGQRMQGYLKPADLKPVPGNANTPLWRNTAQWARHTMLRNGLLKADLPKDIWELTEKGHAALDGKS
jgi:hypothetical protein